MRGAWTYQRKNRKGWSVGWYDSNGRKRSKSGFPNKSLADRFARRLEYQFNEDIYFDPIAVQWIDLIKKYLRYKKDVTGLVPESIRSIEITLTHFKAINGPVLSTKINQKNINGFIAQRRKKVANATINKDIRNLKTFLKWCRENRYISKNLLKWPMQKVYEPAVDTLNKTEVDNLLIAANNQSYEWYLAILLAVSSGLRKGDILRIKLSDIDFESETVRTFSKKTRKRMAHRPLHSVAVNALLKHRDSMPEGRDNLFVSKLHNTTWHRICKTAGIKRHYIFHSLRKCFSSFVQQAGYSQSVAQDLLEHSTPALTHRIYTNVQPVFRKAINSIPIKPLKAQSE